MKESAILTGLVVSSGAAFLNIVEATVLKPDISATGIPFQAAFFFLIWLLLFVVPTLHAAAGPNSKGKIDLSLLTLTATAFVLAILCGLALRWFTGCSIHYGLELSTDSCMTGMDRLRFNPDTLVILGSVWTVVAFWPMRALTKGNRLGTWATAYLICAGIAGFIYSLVVSFPGGDPHFETPAATMAIGFGILSVASLLPGVLYARRMLTGDFSQIGQYALVSFASCTLAMLVGLSGTVEASMDQRLVLSALQGVAGAAVPLVLATSVWINIHYFGLSDVRSSTEPT